MKPDKLISLVLKISGILEIIFGIVILFLGPVMNILNIQFLSFWHLSFGVALALMGILLFVSASDIKRYAVIPFISCIFRLIIACFQIFTAFSEPSLALYMILGAIFDIGVPIFILILLFKNNIHILIKDFETQSK